ncbi:MAG: heavy-metal-associated domain-containing protein [Ekhidna sp.]
MRIVLSMIASMTMLLSIAQNEPIEVDGGFKIEIKTSAICEMCQYTLEKDLAFEKGVKEATLNLDDKVMSITYNPKKTDPETLRKRITKVGYHADTLARNLIAYDNLPMCCKDGSHGTPIPQVPLKAKDGN